MPGRTFQKMAGTSAVFISTDYDGASPVERDGLTWSASELGFPDTPAPLRWQPPMPSVLALEGLEDYDPPQPGDARYVTNLGIALVYLPTIRGWVELTAFA